MTENKPVCDICGYKDTDDDEKKCKACAPAKSSAGGGGKGKFTPYGSKIKDNVKYTWDYVLPD